MIVQMLFGAIVPLIKERDVSPPVNGDEKVPLPQPLKETPGVLYTANPAGKASLKLTPVIVSVVGLFILKVMVEVPPGEIALGVNDLDIVTDEGPIMLTMRAPNS